MITDNNLDTKFIIVVMRQNMFPDKQMVHNFHLGFLIGRAVDNYLQKRYAAWLGHPSVLLFGEKDEAGVHARGIELSKLGIEFVEWRDPDAKPEHDDFGLTGIVTEPITKPQRNKLPRMVQWSQTNNVYPECAAKEGYVAKEAVSGV